MSPEQEAHLATLAARGATLAARGLGDARENVTVRDYFAAEAIGAVMGTPWFQHTSSQRGSCEYADELAGECYAIADAMIKERAK